MKCAHKPQSYKNLLTLRLRTEKCCYCKEDILLKDGESKRDWLGFIATIYILVLYNICFSYVQKESAPPWAWELILLVSVIIFMVGWYIACRYFFQYISVKDEENRLPRIRL